MKISCRSWLLLAAAVLAPACVSSKDQLLATDEPQLKIRSYQTRSFDMTDQDRALRTIIATMQDLEFVIQRADADLGAVSGTKLDGYRMRLTVTVRPRGSTQLLVRANAQFGLAAIEDPKPYQNFFVALEKAMFLTAHEVD
jgi:HEAT repeat protein